VCGANAGTTTSATMHAPAAATTPRRRGERRGRLARRVRTIVLGYWPKPAGSGGDPVGYWPDWYRGLATT